MAASESGIPDIPFRVDQSSGAREWNKMREAVLSIYGRLDEPKNPVVCPEAYGFAPIGLRYYEKPEEGVELERGVGLWPGKLRFLRTPTICEPSGDDNEAVEIYPTLGGDTIDSDPAPRENLDDGDYEAWVIYRELGDTYEAYITFVALDVGPGTIDRDEKAIRLCTFEVTNDTVSSTLPPQIFMYEQIVQDNLGIWTDNHQFRVRKTEAEAFKVAKGFIVWQKGPSYPLVSESFEVDESAEITIPGVNGSIWLNVSWGTAQHSTSNDGGGGSPTVTLTNYRLDSLSTAAYSFRTAAPARGTDTTNYFSTGDLWYEIAKIEYGADEAFITDQIINGPIYVNELSDSVLS